MLTVICKVTIGLGKSAIKKPNNISNKYFITSILSSPPHITRGKTDTPKHRKRKEKQPVETLFVKVQF